MQIDRKHFINARLRRSFGSKRPRWPRRKDWFRLERNPKLVTFTTQEARYV